MENPLYDVFLEAGQQAGFPLSEDINGEQQEGFGALQMNVHNGVRDSAARAYTYKLDERLSFLSNQVAFAINERFVLKLQPNDLTIPMWRVLVVLHDRGEQKLVDLSSLTSIEGSTLSRLTEAMHDRKLIRKARSTRSKREIVISLRPSGLPLVEALIPEAIELETVMLADIDERDIATTRRVLKTMYSLITLDTLPLGDDLAS